MVTCYLAMRNTLLVVSDGVESTAVDDDRATADDVGPAVSRQLRGHTLECLAVDQTVPDRLFVGTFDAGLLRSTDGGGTFERVGADEIAPESITAVAVGARDAEEVWVGTEPSRIYRSTDGGETWTEKPGLTDLPSADEWSFPPRPHTHHVRWIEPDPYDAEHLYVGIEAGALVQTHDGGETWEDRRPTARRDNHSMTTHPEAPGYAWVAAGDGYAETRDGGASWAKPEDGLDHRYCWSVAVDQEDPACVLVSAARGARTAHTVSRADAHVYRRRDGQRWQRLDGRGLPMGEGVVRAVIARGLAGETFYAATNRGLYRTADQGSSWTAVDIEWPESLRSQTPRDIAVVPSTSSVSN